MEVLGCRGGGAAYRSAEMQKGAEVKRCGSTEKVQRWPCWCRGVKEVQWQQGAGAEKVQRRYRDAKVWCTCAEVQCWWCKKGAGAEVQEGCRCAEVDMEVLRC
jgi:hypothetical protein